MRKNAESAAPRRDNIDRRRLEGAQQVGLRHPQYQHAETDDHECEQVPMLTSSPTSPIGKIPARIVTIKPVTIVVT